MGRVAFGRGGGSMSFRDIVILAVLVGGAFAAVRIGMGTALKEQYKSVVKEAQKEREIDGLATDTSQFYGQ